MKLSDIWIREFTSLGQSGHPHCGLCANNGVIDTTKLELKTAAGDKLRPLKTYCICPNGRAMKKGKAKI